MQRPAHGFRLAPILGALFVLLLVLAAWPAGESEAQWVSDQAQARKAPTRASARTPVAAPASTTRQA